jgi:hypothetical protein
MKEPLSGPAKVCLHFLYLIDQDRKIIATPNCRYPTRLPEPSEVEIAMLALGYTETAEEFKKCLKELEDWRLVNPFEANGGPCFSITSRGIIAVGILTA